MRRVIIIALLLAAGCRQEPDFDNRYKAAEQKLEAKSKQIDQEISGSESSEASR